VTQLHQFAVAHQALRELAFLRYAEKPGLQSSVAFQILVGRLAHHSGSESADYRTKQQVFALQGVDRGLFL
jgi:hypothetical protein